MRFSSKPSGKSAIVLAVGASALLLYGCSAQADPPKPPTPIAIDVLTPRAAFTDDVAIQTRLKLDGRGAEMIKAADPSHIVTARITVQPGAQFPWHTHHGPVFVTVVQGEMTYLSSKDCVGRRYASGTAFVDPGHPVHTAYNSGKIETVLMTTFFEVPEGPRRSASRPMHRRIARSQRAETRMEGTFLEAASIGIARAAQ